MFEVNRLIVNHHLEHLKIITVPEFLTKKKGFK